MTYRERISELAPVSSLQLSVAVVCGVFIRCGVNTYIQRSTFVALAQRFLDLYALPVVAQAAHSITTSERIEEHMGSRRHSHGYRSIVSSYIIMQKNGVRGAQTHLPSPCLAIGRKTNSAPSITPREEAQSTDAQTRLALLPQEGA